MYHEPFKSSLRFRTRDLRDCLPLLYHGRGGLFLFRLSNVRVRILVPEVQLLVRHPSKFKGWIGDHTQVAFHWSQWTVVLKELGLLTVLDRNELLGQMRKVSSYTLRISNLTYGVEFRDNLQKIFNFLECRPLFSRRFFGFQCLHFEGSRTRGLRNLFRW